MYTKSRGAENFFLLVKIPSEYLTYVGPCRCQPLCSNLSITGLQFNDQGDLPGLYHSLQTERVSTPEGDCAQHLQFFAAPDVQLARHSRSAQHMRRRSNALFREADADFLSTRESARPGRQGRFSYSGVPG